jgi:exodeoxyribonuclease V alpha subunit
MQSRINAPKATSRTAGAKNRGNVSNGDVGYVTQIVNTDDEASLRVDFGDGRTASYDTSELELLELAYASP